MAKRTLLEPAVERLPERLKVMLAVAEKALTLGKPLEAERLLASTVKDYQAFAEFASTPDDRDDLARSRELLSPILRRLEAATGKPWMRCLEASRHPAWWYTTRGQA